MQNKILGVLDGRNEPLLGHEIFAIVHGLPHYIARSIDPSEFVALVVKLCPSNPFLALKYATDALDACKSCGPVLEAISLLVAAYPPARSVLDYSDVPSLVRILSQYVLSKDPSVSKPAQSALTALHREMNEQLFTYVASDKIPAVRSLIAPQIIPANDNNNAITTNNNNNNSNNNNNGDILSVDVRIGSGLVASSPEPGVPKFTEEELANLGRAIDQALKGRDFDGLVRRVCALHQILAGAIAEGAPPPPHVYEAEELLAAMARVVPIMQRDRKIEVPVVGAMRTLNACLKRGYLDVHGLSQECVSVLIRSLLLHRHEELHRGLVVVFKLGNPFRISVALVQLARTLIADEPQQNQQQRQCAQMALGLMDEAALLCARDKDPERNGLLGLLNEIRGAVVDSMTKEEPPYEVAKACVRMLRTIHSGNRALTERLCRNVQILATFIDDEEEKEEEEKKEEEDKDDKEFVMKMNNDDDDDDCEDTIERSHTPLGQNQSM